MQISLPAAITKITTMRDKTVRLQVDCQETAAEEMANLFALNDKLGYFFFADQVIKEIDTKDLPEIKLDKDEKSPGSRLRAALWVLHEQKGGKPEDFDPYYRRQMERFIEAVKEQLN